MGFRLHRSAWIGLLAFAMACGGGSASGAGSGRKMLDPDDDARSGYEKALLDFRRGDCLSAEPMFREIRREFPYSRFAALAELRVGDCQFKNEAYPEAIQTYRQFVRIRPSHKEIPYARFRIAEAYYNQIPGGWFMTPPAAERDQSAARDALIQHFGEGPVLAANHVAQQQPRNHTTVAITEVAKVVVCTHFAAVNAVDLAHGFLDERVS